LVISGETETTDRRMEVVVFRDGGGGGKRWPAFALADKRLCEMVRDGHLAAARGRRVSFVMPHHWQAAWSNGDGSVMRYGRKDGMQLPAADGEECPEWIVISSGAAICRTRREWLERRAKDAAADAVCVQFDADLIGYHEKVRVTRDNEIVGWRRYYGDGIEPCRTPQDWPHKIYIRSSALRKILPGKALTSEFAKFAAACSASSVKLVSIKAAGRVLDLETEEGLLGLVRHACSRQAAVNDGGPASIGKGARLVGKVIFGRGVRIGERAVVVGPAVLGDGVQVSDRAIVKGAVITRGVHVPADAVVRDRVVRDGQTIAHSCRPPTARRVSADFSENGEFERDYFRVWRPWSYPRYIKRLFDVAASAAILLLFLPFFPVIALAIKMNSPGPVFYRARRQGLGGKEFDCLKFRTMVPTAEGLQEKLRAVNQVDGPQFKMDNDPRVNALGRFLRDTNIDEIPQFINVLRGQMSVIGPRPSPERENVGCPQWRYARLSVRPGITGLWQLCRTREEGTDFQEWVHYDTKYVRELSFRMDLWIFWKTAMKLINGFVDQF